jgi:hypothetical protein
LITKSPLISYAIPAALIIATFAVVVVVPVVLGEHDETGLMVSLLTTPIAAFLVARARARSAHGIVVSTATAAAIIALVIGGISYAMWCAFAEPWMFNYLYAIIAMIAISVVLEVFGAVMIALFVSALRPRTGEHP